MASASSSPARRQCRWVVDIAESRSRVDGFIPTGWYPTAVRALPNGTLSSSTARGCALLERRERSQPGQACRARCMPGNRTANRPVLWAACRPALRVDRTLHTGATQRLTAKTSLPTRHTATPTRQTEPASQHRARDLCHQGKPNLRPGARRSESKGNGDRPVPFRRNSTPNLHKWFANSSCWTTSTSIAMVSGDGHNWSTAAIAPDYVSRRCGPTSTPTAATLTISKSRTRSPLAASRIPLTNSRCRRRLLRNFGYMVNNKGHAVPGKAQITGVRDPVLAKGHQPAYIAASTSTIRTSSGSRSSQANSPNVRRPETWLA